MKKYSFFSSSQFRVKLFSFEPGCLFKGGCSFLKGVLFFLKKKKTTSLAVQKKSAKKKLRVIPLLFVEFCDFEVAVLNDLWWDSGRSGTIKQAFCVGGVVKITLWTHCFQAGFAGQISCMIFPEFFDF